MFTKLYSSLACGSNYGLNKKLIFFLLLNFNLQQLALPLVLAKMNLEYFSYDKGKVVSIINVNKLNITVKFGKGEPDTFLKMDAFEHERYDSHREPDDDGFSREFLFDADGDVMWVKKTVRNEFLTKAEEELVDWYQQEEESRLIRLAQPFNYEKDEDNFY